MKAPKRPKLSPNGEPWPLELREDSRPPTPTWLLALGALGFTLMMMDFWAPGLLAHMMREILR